MSSKVGVDLTDGLILCLDATNPRSVGDKWYDISNSENDHSATLNGTQWVTDKGVSNALYFENGYGQITHHDELNFTGSAANPGPNGNANGHDFTIGFWMRAPKQDTDESTHSDKAVIEKWHQPGGYIQYSYVFRLHSDESTGRDGELWLMRSNKNDSSYITEVHTHSLLDGIPFTDKRVDDDKWYNICVTKTSMQLNMYVQGELVDTTGEFNADAYGGVGTFAGPSHLYLGRRGGNADWQYSGSLADIRMYNRALDADEISGYYKLTKSKFSPLGTIDISF